MAAYTNGYKGRANRQESASHLKDEFDRIEGAFVALQNSNTSYSEIYNHEGGTDYVLIDPANGQMQEITLAQDTLIEIQSPGSESDSESHRLTLIVHGAGFRVINGWGPQTWKEEGSADWMWIYTGDSAKAGAMLEFSYDGMAWTCLAFSRNQFGTSVDEPDFDGITAMFPMISHLDNVEDTTTLTWVRNSYGWAADIDATFVMTPPDTARYFGGRYVKNWIATPSDLQSVAWEEDGASVTTEAAAGQDGGNVDKVTFDSTNGELRTWMLLHFGRPAESADPVKFAISFDAKMAGVVASGTCRAVISVMGVDTGATIRWDREEFSVDNTWKSYGAILDPITGKDLKGLNLNTPAGARTLIKFAIESPSDGLGDPILIENVNVAVLKEGDDEKVSLPLASTIGASMVLAATSGSTGTWVDGTKVMTLGLGEYVDFQDSLEVGKSYLCVATRTVGNTADVRMENDRTYWTAYSKSGGDTSFVKDAPFTFQYEGGVFKFYQARQTSGYLVNIYEISDFSASYGTANENTIGQDKQITYTVGANIASNIAVGTGYEKASATNLLPAESHRNFGQWDQVLTPMRVSRSEFGLDGRPAHGSVVEDNSTSHGAFIMETQTIADDANQYIFSIYVRKTRNRAGSIIHRSQRSASAGGPVTSPSSYVDFKLLIYDVAQTNEANWVEGDEIRLNVKTGVLAEAGNTYSHKTVINYQNWWHVQVALRNNAAGNDRIAMILFPSIGKASTAISRQDQNLRGYAIYDWAQLEISEGFATSAAIPGEVRGADSITSTLDDGTLYDSVPTEVGDLTTNDFTFDASNIYKNITWNKT